MQEIVDTVFKLLFRVVLTNIAPGFRWCNLNLLALSSMHTCIYYSMFAFTVKLRLNSEAV